jgi:hypothetical protein
MRADMLRLRDGSELPPDAVLGVITIFTVPDKSVDGGVLTSQWAREGLDPKFIPDVRKPVDDFRQACRRVETRKSGTSNGHRTEVKVDEVTNQGTVCVYQITRMVRDHTNNVIDHPKAMTLHFNKDDAEADPTSANCVTVIPQDPATFGVLKGLADDILKWYDAHRSEVPGQKVRNAIREVIVQLCGGENLRRQSGGVYFVPKDGADTLASLARVCDNLYGGDADFSFWPQPNTKAALKMVAKHHVMNVQNDADEMIAKITERVKNGGKVRKDLLTNLVQRRRELGAHRKKYIDILGTEQKLITEKLEMLDDQLETLMAMAI